MRTNPFYDAWLFLIGRTNDHENRGVGWLLTILFIALLLASIWIARRNWREDPDQQTGKHLTIWFMRVMIGAMWFQGSLWKLPLRVSGGFEAWTKALGDYAAFGFHRWIAKNIFVSLLPLIDPLAFLTELSLAISFILGFLLRPMGAIGMVYVAQLWLGLYLSDSEWPWLYVFLIFVQGFFVLDNAGRSFGLDGLLARAPFGPFVGDGALARFYQNRVGAPILNWNLPQGHVSEGPFLHPCGRRSHGADRSRIGEVFGDRTQGCRPHTGILRSARLYQTAQAP